jgi:MFS family permease
LIANSLLAKNKNYRLLFSSGALTNLGDGMMVLALPWLATLLTSDPVAIASVAALNRLPWLFFALPAGVVADRTDRRKLIARADFVRAFIVSAILLLALSTATPISIWLLAGLAFLLGTAEVFRDNAAQTILPDIVAKDDLEKANGQMWSVEQITGEFVGPPLAGLLIGFSIAIPFGVDVAALVLAGSFAWFISTVPQPKPTTSIKKAFIEGISYMRQDKLLLRLAIVLGLANFLATGVTTVQVLFAQNVLGLSADQYGFILSFAAVGAVLGGLGAPKLIELWGVQKCLVISVGVWGIGYTAIGMTNNAFIMAFSLFCVMAAALVWNVITVSWRQRRIPSQLLGRVNSIYRFFGWGSMPLGALAGGAIIAVTDDYTNIEFATRAPFIAAGILCLLLTIYVALKVKLSD